MLEDAAAAFQQAINHKKDYAKGYNNFGVVLVRLGKFRQGFGSPQKTVELDRHHPHVQYHIFAKL